MHSSSEISDLGIMARGDQWMDWRAGHTPEGNPCLIGGLSRGGFALIEPAARRIRQIRPPVCLSTSWGFCQTPDGNIWQVDFGQHSEAALCVWEGKGDTSRVATRLPLRYLFALEAFSDGSLLLGNQKQPVLHRWEPSSGRLEEWSRLPGKTGAQVILRGRDGWIYILGSEGRDRVIYAANPGGQVSLLLRLELHNPVMWYEVLKRNREGTVFVQDPGKGRWWRLAGGNATGAGEEMPEGLVRVRQWPSVGFAAFGYTLPALMPDGTRVESITDRTFGCRSPEGAAFSFTADRSETPLRIFSVAAARGKIWGGTFIPLTLFSHDLRTGKTVNHGNPTQSSSGEIYSIAEQGGKLFFGSYANASITRYDPDAPWQPGFLAESNPRELGMVSESPDTHRPVASIAHPDGGVYFCAYDTYLPEKIGAIARVDPSSEQIARWALPDLEISSAAAGPAPGQLLLAHRGPDPDWLSLSLVDFGARRLLRTRRLIRDAGGLTSLLVLKDGSLILQHDYRARLMRVDPHTFEVTHQLDELGLGDLCHNSLVELPDGRIAGLTHSHVFTVDPLLEKAMPMAEYAKPPDRETAYRFGLCLPGDGHLYFANGCRLMRLRIFAKEEP